MVYKKDGTPIRYANDYNYKEVGEDFWWTFDEIKQAKAARAIRLDGYVDEAYVNSFTYYHESTNATYGAGDNSTTRLHWYEDSDALYLAFVWYK